MALMLKRDKRITHPSISSTRWNFATNIYLYIYIIVYRYVIHNMSLLQYTYILKSTRHTLKTKILKKLSESTPQGSSIFERGGPGPGICSRYRLAVGQVKKWTMLGKRSSDDVGRMMGITLEYMENIWAFFGGFIMENHM